MGSTSETSKPDSPCATNSAARSPWSGPWFRLSGDTRLGACATEGCGGQPIYRYEANGVGSNYCSGCQEKIAAQSSDAHLNMWRLDAAKFRAMLDDLFHGMPMEANGTIKLTPFVKEKLAALSAHTYKDGKRGPQEARELIKLLAATSEAQ